METIKLQFPVDIKNTKISQYFGLSSSSICQKWYEDMGLLGHNGLDFSVSNGTNITASHAGILTCGHSDSAGIWAKIENKKDGIKTVYYHLKEVLSLNKSNVKAGTYIAYSDNTGLYTTGPHLHFGLYLIDKYGNTLNLKNGYQGAIDPLPFLVMAPPNGSLIKTINDNRVWLIKDGKRWWLSNEVVFKNFMGYSVNLAEIKVVDIPTLNSIPVAGTIINN